VTPLRPRSPALSLSAPAPAPGYNKRLRKAAELLRVTRLLAADTSVWSDDVWIVDSTPMECGRSRETLLDPLTAEPGLTSARPGQTLIGDKNYFGRTFEDELAKRDIRRGRTMRTGAVPSRRCSSAVAASRSASREAGRRGRRRARPEGG
jgi:hypothetical protein